MLSIEAKIMIFKKLCRIPSSTRLIYCEVYKKSLPNQKYYLWKQSPLLRFCARSHHSPLLHTQRNTMVLLQCYSDSETQFSTGFFGNLLCSCSSRCKIFERRTLNKSVWKKIWKKRQCPRSMLCRESCHQQQWSKLCNTHW